MRDALSTFRSKGAELIVVGSGAPWHAKAFRDARGLEFPLYVDSELVAYRAAGLRRGIWATLGPRNWWGGLRAIFRKRRQGRTQGDPWQQGGVFVFGADGATRFRHINRGSSDHVRIDRVIAAL